jgi:hypothetical protein
MAANLTLNLTHLTLSTCGDTAKIGGLDGLDGIGREKGKKYQRENYREKIANIV